MTRPLVLILTLLIACGSDDDARPLPPLPPSGPPVGLGRVATGDGFSCAIDLAGRVFCWGQPPNAGEPTHEPVRVRGLDGAVELVAQGPALCGRKEDGTVLCIGPLVPRTGPQGDAPSPIPELSPARQVVLHGNGTRACALLRNRSVRCYPTEGRRPWAERIPLRDVERLHGTTERVCARHGDGTVSCFDRVSSGPRRPPVKLAEHDVAWLSPGFLFCRAGRDGRGRCSEWREGEQPPESPVRPLRSDRTLVRVESAQSSQDYFEKTDRVCAVDGGGRLWCGRVPPRGGEIDLGSSALVSDVRDYALGVGHGCALRVDGEVLCWGDNRRGQVGREIRDTGDPVQVPRIRDAIAVAIGDHGSCALREGGRVTCWGTLTDPSDVPILHRSEPRDVEGLPVIRAIAVTRALYALAEDGRLYGWGARAEDADRPVVLTDLGRVDELAAGAGRVCVRSGTTVRCADYLGAFEVVPEAEGMTELRPGVSGTCGSRDGRMICTPGTEPALPRAGAGGRLFFGGEQACVTDRFGAVRCLGHNGVGQLGLPPSRPIERLTDVPGLSGIVGAAFDYHVSCFWQTAGPLYCAGLDPEDLVPRGRQGGLGLRGAGNDELRGDGSIHAIEEIRNVRTVDVGQHGCAVTRGGEVWCWGRNRDGQLGRGDPHDVLRPARVPLPEPEFTAGSGLPLPI